MGAVTISRPHPVCISLKNISDSNTPIMACSSVQVFGPTRYGPTCSGSVAARRSLKRCFAIVIRPKRRIQLDENREKMLMKDFIEA